MTSNALQEKIISLAGESGTDPVSAISCISAAGKIAGITEPGDIVIWPEDEGGLAWTASGIHPAGKGRHSRRILCVSMNHFPYTVDLWRTLNLRASESGKTILPVRLFPGETNGKDRDYPRFIQRILDKFFPVTSPASEETAGKSDTIRLHYSDVSGVAGIPIPEPEKHIREWLDESPRRVYLSSALDIRERFLAAAAAVSADLLPMISLRKGEAARALSLYRKYFADNRRKTPPSLILRIEEDWDALSLFRSQGELTLLSPVSEADFLSALKWASGNPGPVLLLNPGNAALPSRKLHESSWESDSFLMVKEKKGSNGSILFIVPGIYAREAVKAADRLHKGDYSAAVMALRFIFPSDIRKLSDTAAAFDLVVIADASGGSGGMKADLGLELMNLNKLQVAVAGKYMKGKALGDFASRVLRENRFRRTVDDVKKDRWR